jgi:hypothetical protein
MQGMGGLPVNMRALQGRRLHPAGFATTLALYVGRLNNGWQQAVALSQNTSYDNSITDGHVRTLFLTCDRDASHH